MTGTTRPQYLIDTVAAVAWLNGDAALESALNPQGTLSIPIIALGELFAGAENSAKVHDNYDRIERLLSESNLLLCDAQTARQYAQISQQLRKKGRPIPQNDMWIAALALQHGLMLVTRDAHFNQVDGLLVQSW